MIIRGTNGLFYERHSDNGSGERYQVFVRRIARKIKGEDEAAYTPDEVERVLNYFFNAYRDYMGEEHPRLKYKQMERLINGLPFVEVKNNYQGYDNGEICRIDPRDYPVIIDQYFVTDFPESDYRLMHFMSGEIRMNRILELDICITC